MMAIPEGGIALASGTVLAIGAALVVLGPLFREETDPVLAPSPVPLPEPGAEERSTAIDALREIEFDRATGKLSDADYSALKASYTRQALAELRARDAAERTTLAALTVDDATVEAEIARYRASHAACAQCGPRPEPDARFCSECGRFLAGRCARCGAACDEPGQRFCGDCGHALAAPGESRDPDQARASAVSAAIQPR